MNTQILKYLEQALVAAKAAAAALQAEKDGRAHDATTAAAALQAEKDGRAHDARTASAALQAERVAHIVTMSTTWEEKQLCH